MRLILLLSILVGFSSCNPEEIGPQYEDELNDIPFNVVTEQAVYIINEGNFNFGNASLSFYNPLTKEHSNQVFQEVNDDALLGDVFQSFYVTDSLYYFVMNNSGKIVITDSDINYQTEISGISSPRYFTKITNEKAYVSDLYADEMSIVSLADNSITGTISTGAWIEQMVWVDDEIWAIDKTNNKILILNPETDSIENEIQLSEGAGNIVEDSSGEIWVLCDGGWSGDELASLYSIDKYTQEILLELSFEEDESPSLLRIDGEKEYLYFHENGVRMMATTASQLPNDILIETTELSIYGMDVNPVNGDIYLCDAIDFVQAGTVYRYTENGNLLDSFSAGQIPRACVFVSQ